MTYTRSGRQILKDGAHHADFVTEDGAQEFMDYIAIPDWLDGEADRRQRKSRFSALIMRIVGGDIRAGMFRGGIQ